MKTKMGINKIVVIIGLLSAVTVTSAWGENCDVSPTKYVEDRAITCLQEPGWFDIGAGIVVLPSAGVAQQNGVGNMVSVRAYPFGRWYAPLKPKAIQGELVSNLQSLANTASATAEQSKTTADTDLSNAIKSLNAAYTAYKNAKTDGALAKVISSWDATTTKTSTDVLAAAKDLLAAAKIEASTNLNPANNAVTDATKAEASATTAATAQAAATGSSVAAAQGMQAVLNAFGSNYSIDKYDVTTCPLKNNLKNT